MTKATAPEKVSVSEAARRLGVSRPTIYAMIARGELFAQQVADWTIVTLPRPGTKRRTLKRGSHA